MQAIGGDTRASQPFGQGAGEENIAKLGIAVSAKALKVFSRLQIGKIQLAPAMRPRRRRDNPRSWRRLELVQQYSGDSEIGHVIEGESFLQSFAGFDAPVEDRAGIVDQH